jgi:hypothetical protein
LESLPPGKWNWFLAINCDSLRVTSVKLYIYQSR